MSYLVVGMLPASCLVVASPLSSNPNRLKGTTMPHKLLLCPGSRTISAATYLLSLQGDMSYNEVKQVAMSATVSGAPHVKVWYDLSSLLEEVGQ